MTNIQLTVDQINNQIRELQIQKNHLSAKANPNVIYQYYTVTIPSTSGRFDQRDCAGHICVALERPPKGVVGVQKYRAAFSFCAPSDSYSKKIGRKIATSRLNNDRKKLSINFEMSPDEDLSETNIKIGDYSLSLSPKSSDENSKHVSLYWQLCFAKALELSLSETHEPKKNGHQQQVTFAPDWFKNLPKEGTKIHIGIH